jgi:hypothetical protein
VGAEFLEPVLSVYAGEYDPQVDYEKLMPTKQVKVESFGGVKPTAYPGAGTQVVRGLLQNKTAGEYEFRPGFGGSTYNIMEVDGQEVYRREPGKEAVYKHLKLAAAQKADWWHFPERD